MTDTFAAAPPPETDQPHVGLSARLLVLTIFFVMLAELLIYAPSIGRFRKDYLEGRIAAAHLATLALEATPDNMVSRELELELLFHAGAHAVALRKASGRSLALMDDQMPTVTMTVRLDRTGFFGWIADAFEVLASGGDRVIRVLGDSPKVPGVMVEVTLDEGPMRAAMLAFSWRILGLSLVISGITAGLVFLSLQWLLVAPMRRMVGGMVAFRRDPENAAAVIVPGRRGDEVGIAERELARMQEELRAALGQKARLAALGAAVAKINHDLRNSLSTAMLASDRLADIDDPEVKQITPRLFDAISRAVNLCSQTLRYAADAAPKVAATPFPLAPLVAEVAETAATLRPGGPPPLLNEVAVGVIAFADREQLRRVVENLAVNAVQAGARTVRVSAAVEGGRLTVRVADDGPGLPPKALAHLFEPFAGSARGGGSGLGLAIARDILRAHGGDIVLEKSDAAGATFRLVLPAAASQGIEA